MAGGARAAPPAGLWPPGPPCHGNRPEWSCRGRMAMQVVMVLPGEAPELSELSHHSGELPGEITGEGLMWEGRPCPSRGGSDATHLLKAPFRVSCWALTSPLPRSLMGKRSRKRWKKRTAHLGHLSKRWTKATGNPNLASIRPRAHWVTWCNAFPSLGSLVRATRSVVSNSLRPREL